MARCIVDDVLLQYIPNHVPCRVYGLCVPLPLRACSVCPYVLAPVARQMLHYNNAYFYVQPDVFLGPVGPYVLASVARQMLYYSYAYFYE